MHILVAGGAGFIGSHIVIELLNSGHTPIVIDNFHNSSPAVSHKIKTISGTDVLFIEADITNENELEKIFKQQRIDAVIHLAALKSVAESIREPLRYHENNVGGLLRLLKTMKAHSCRTFIYSSSATIFGIPARLPIEEAAPFQSTNPYGSTKIIGEYLLQDMARTYKNWKIMSLRYFNPAGAHKSGLLGEMPPSGEPANLFPAIMFAYKNLANQFKVYGDDYDTKDGTCVRDYLHITDLAQAHIKAVEKCIETDVSGYTAVNLGSGQGYTVMEVIKAFEQVTGEELPYEIMPRRPGDVAVNYTSTKFAKEFLNWETQRGLNIMWQDALRFAEKIN